ncbi:hypothetical protein [Frigoribacterium salinisoli]
MSSRAASFIVVLLCALELSACTIYSPATNADLGAAALPDRQTAQEALDRVVERFIGLVPRDGDEELVDRMTDDVALSCSASAVQRSRFVDVRPRSDGDPDGVIREIAASLRETGESEVQEDTDLGGGARLFAQEIDTGASIVMGQRTLPVFQITAYSPCYAQEP